jgi:heme/copper-type cytochrome/quinol oxidase subunit 4
LPLAPEYNVSSWLVARVAILAIFQIILKLMYFLEGSLLWQNKIGRTLFFWKKNM